MAGNLYLGSQKVLPMQSTREPANLTSITITPSIQTQVINATGMTDGYNTITVNAVTNAIDPCIAPENIRQTISILNVTGIYEGDVEKVLLDVIAGNNPVNTTGLRDAEMTLHAITTRTWG